MTRVARVATMCGLGLALVASSPAFAQSPSDADPAIEVEAPTPAATPSAAAVQQAVVDATNVIRAKRGLPTLRAVAPLTRAAGGHSTFLATSGLFQHEDAGGRPFWNRLVKAGYPRNSTMAENIAMTAGCGPDTARQAMSLWMNSAPHRANILNSKLRAIGVGVVSNADCSQVYLTVDFGSAVTR